MKLLLNFALYLFFLYLFLGCNNSTNQKSVCTEHLSTSNLSAFEQENLPVLFPIGQYPKWGYMDNQGKMIIKPSFDLAKNFSEGRAAVKLGYNWRFIDKNGRFIGSSKFSEVRDFSEGRAAVKLGYSWGFINLNGQLIIDERFASVSDFKGGIAAFSEDKITLQPAGYIDRNGKIIIKLRSSVPAIDEYDGFQNGLTQVWVDEQNTIWGIFNSGGNPRRRYWGYINSIGKLIIPMKYDYAYSFSECLAAIKINNKYGYIDTFGNIVIEPNFELAGNFIEGLAPVKIDKKYGYINKKGAIIISPQFDYASEFSEGLAIVEIDSKEGYINKAGKIVISPQFDYASNFDRGLASIELREKSFYIDKTGKVIQVSSK